MLNNNHDIAANKGKIKGQLPLEHIFGFRKTFKKITKQFGFHLTLKTADLQDIIYTKLADIIIKTDKLFLYVPMFIPDAETQIIFIELIKNSFTFSFEFWTSDRKTVNNQLEYQVDKSSAQNINRPKYLIVAHQTADRIGVSNIRNNTAVFDNLDVRKYFAVIDGVRYPRDTRLLMILIRHREIKKISDGNEITEVVI